MAAPTPGAIRAYTGVATAVFLWMAWAPWLPPPESLRQTQAHVESMGEGTGVAILRSSRDGALPCPYGGWPGLLKCDETALAAAHAARRVVQVRHDGERVHHAQDGEHIIVSSDWSSSARLMSSLLALIFGAMFAFQSGAKRTPPPSGKGNRT